MSYSQPLQDRPPAMPQTIKFRRFVPKKGPSGALIFLSIFGIMGYGWHAVAQSNAERREIRREKAWARIALVPLLQAETDRDLVRRLESAKEKEAKIMTSSYPDWSAMDLKAPVVPASSVAGRRHAAVAEGEEDKNVPVYHTDKYVVPRYVFLPTEDEDRVKPQWWRGTKMFLRNPPYHERADWEGKKDPIAEW